MGQQPITDWNQVPIVMDLPFASRIVGQSYETLKKRSQQGKFPAYKEGNEWRVEKTALLEHIRANAASGLQTTDQTAYPTPPRPTRTSTTAPANIVTRPSADNRNCSDKGNGSILRTGGNKGMRRKAPVIQNQPSRKPITIAYDTAAKKLEAALTNAQSTLEIIQLTDAIGRLASAERLSLIGDLTEHVGKPY